MELLYKIAGCVSYDTASDIVIYRVQQMQNMNIPVIADTLHECILHEGRYLMPAIEFSFYKRADEHFEEMFLDCLQTGMTPKDGELYIANPYTGRKRVFIVRGGVICVKACY